MKIPIQGFNCTLEFNDKPPLGIMPRYIWLEKRITDLLQTMLRYMEQPDLENIQKIKKLNDELKLVIDDRLMEGKPRNV